MKAKIQCCLWHYFEIKPFITTITIDKRTHTNKHVHVYGINKNLQSFK